MYFGLDMVGHTGVYDADSQWLQRIGSLALYMYMRLTRSTGYILFVAADHSNAEEMVRW